MIFNNIKKTKVSYFINDDNKIVHPILYKEIEPYISNDVGCPAVGSYSNRVFNLFPVIDCEIEFGINNSEPYYTYNFSDKYKNTDYVHELIKSMLIVDVSKGKATLQILNNYVFVTDKKDLEISILPSPHIQLKNCKFIPGGFYLKNWTRTVHSSFIQATSKQPSKIKFNVSNPLALIVFNKPIKLQQIEPTKKILKYYNNIVDITYYVSGVNKYISKIINKRPKRLL